MSRCRCMLQVTTNLGRNLCCQILKVAVSLRVSPYRRRVMTPRTLIRVSTHGMAVECIPSFDPDSRITM